MLPFHDPSHFDFTGRAPRRQYALSQLVLFGAGIAFGLVMLALAVLLGNWSWPLIVVLGLAFLYVTTHFSLSQGAKRSHDLGHSGWIQLVTLLPLVGWLFWFYLLFAPGQAESNQYGELPSA